MLLKLYDCCRHADVYLASLGHQGLCAWTREGCFPSCTTAVFPVNILSLRPDHWWFGKERTSPFVFILSFEVSRSEINLLCAAQALFWNSLLCFKKEKEKKDAVNKSISGCTVCFWSHSNPGSCCLSKLGKWLWMGIYKPEDFEVQVSCQIETVLTASLALESVRHNLNEMWVNTSSPVYLFSWVFCRFWVISWAVLMRITPEKPNCQMAAIMESKYQN